MRVLIYTHSFCTRARVYIYWHIRNWRAFSRIEDKNHG